MMNKKINILLVKYFFYIFLSLTFLNISLAKDVDIQEDISLSFKCDLIKKIHLIERKLHKNKRIINGPRKIDLDIIFWDKKIFKNNNLVIPHPRLQERDFVLCPLLDIAPFFKDPVSKLSVKELIKNLKDHYVIKKLNYRNLF